MTVTFTSCYFIICLPCKGIFLVVADPKKITSGSTENYKEEGAWAAVLGTHVLNKLAGSNVVLFDNGYSERIKECPCGCQTVLNFGDTSIGKLS